MYARHMTTSKNYGPRHETIGQVGITSYGQHLYGDAMTFSQNLGDATRRSSPDVVALRQHLLNARKAMDAAERETFIVDYYPTLPPTVTDIEGRVFGIDASDLSQRPTDTLLQEARNYLIQEILDALKADQELTFAWVTVRTPKPTPKPVVKVTDGQYTVSLPGDLAFAIDVVKADLLPLIHDAIEAYKAGEVGIEAKAEELYSANGESSLPWHSLGNLEQSGWLYAARLGGR